MFVEQAPLNNLSQGNEREQKTITDERQDSNVYCDIDSISALVEQQSSSYLMDTSAKHTQNRTKKTGIQTPFERHCMEQKNNYLIDL